MLILDKTIGLIAPNICIGCAREGYVLCPICLSSAGNPFPPRCAGCKKLSDNYRTCSSCKNWLEIYSVYVSTTYEGLYEQLVHDLKFNVKRQAVEPMAEIMTQVVPNISGDVIICPIPTASSRIRQRGFDHSKLLAKEYRKKLEQKYNINWKVENILGRKSNVRQLGSSRQKRIEQMEQEFYIDTRLDLKRKTILIIDDVTTTSASISAAAKVLKQAGAKRIYATLFAQKA